MTAFTSAAFVRAHGRRPSGRGQWAFQQTRSESAFSADLVGPVVWASGTLTEAKRQIAAAHPGTTMAVLP